MNRHNPFLNCCLLILLSMATHVTSMFAECLPTTFINDSNLGDTTSFNQLKLLLSQRYPHYVIMDTILGDLNLDAELDLIVVLNKEIDSLDSSLEDQSISRKTVLLVMKEGNYFIAAANDYIIDCSDCGGGGVGDPYHKPIIDHGTIYFESLYGDCDKTHYAIVFNYTMSIANWELSQITQTDYNCNQTGGEIKEKTTIKTPKEFGSVPFDLYH